MMARKRRRRPFLIGAKDLRAGSSWSKRGQLKRRGKEVS
jgi:hypothetical protein